jgi:tight adherence protein C
MGPILLFAGVAALAAAVPLTLLGLARARVAQAGRREAVRYLGEGDGVARAGALGPTGRLFAGLGRRLTRPGYLERTRERLGSLGSDLAVERFLAYKGMGAAAGAVLGLWSMAGNAGLGFAVLVILAPIGFAYPDVWLRRRQRNRAEQIRRALPDSLDLMAISVEAGVGLEGAMARAAEDLGGPLGEEYARLLHEMQLGTSRHEAFQAMRRRVGLPEMTSFVLALLQADSLGIAVGKVLKTQAGELRLRRRQRAKEQAAKTPVKILFPLVFGIFPALLIVVLGPAVIRIAGTIFTP